jgi:hypothetical protein
MQDAVKVGSGNMTTAEREQAAMMIWNKEKGTAAAVIVLAWIAKVFPSHLSDNGFQPRLLCSSTSPFFSTRTPRIFERAPTGLFRCPAQMPITPFQILRGTTHPRMWKTKRKTCIIYLSAHHVPPAPTHTTHTRLVWTLLALRGDLDAPNPGLCTFYRTKSTHIHNQVRESFLIET